ncbi:MAG: FAD-dependent oxidoreductase, partial [Cyanobacteria bacterium J06636_27]
MYDVIVIGSGIGGLVTATQLVAKGAKVLVLEGYTIPG